MVQLFMNFRLNFMTLAISPFRIPSRKLETTSLPLSVDFDISASNPNQVIPTNELVIYYLLPGLAAVAAVVAYLKHKNKI
jgi:hypothetical protein